ncbi:MAG: ABC transporter ATP-binding protein, partial [Gordonia sp. (in: high G+C Gram-positive bacteria)]
LVLQDALVSLDPLRTVGKEITEALTAHKKVRREDIPNEVHRLLAEVGIPDPEIRSRQYPHELSGGLRQRALIATAIACNPRLVIADEPTTALDATVAAQILALLRARLATGTALLLISHDLSLVAEIADEVSVMRAGRIVEQGPPSQVLLHPRDDYTKKLLAAVPTAAARGFRLSGTEIGSGRLPLPPRTIDERRVLLEARAISKTFPVRGGARRTAVHEAHVQLHPGETIGIVGESGSGKTTLIRAILGLAELDSGSVELDGQPWNPLPERQRRARRSTLQLVAQDPLSSFDPRYTVRRLIIDGTKAAGVPPAQRDARVDELLNAVGLSTAYRDRRPARLSGGERQRVAIARALAAQPEILVCDEPVSALDVSVQAQVLDLLADLRHSLGTATLFVSHDLGVIYQVSDRVIVMEKGHIVETGDVERVYQQPEHPYTRRLLDSIPKLSSAAIGR